MKSSIDLKLDEMIKLEALEIRCTCGEEFIVRSFDKLDNGDYKIVCPKCGLIMTMKTKATITSS